MLDLDTIISFAVISLCAAILEGRMEVPTAPDIKRYVAEETRERIKTLILEALNKDFLQLVQASTSIFTTIE